ncbi:MAG: hypothetical protein PHP31_07035 [Lentimicrobiaceae bacterium]|nr:hypothetical protein [Lentimicrobiaceae bacterium]
MNPTILEWIGYVASILIAISLATKSIIRLRWINLFGAIVFFIYGYLIKSVPVFAVNVFITIIDIYYLYEIYSKKIKISIIKVSESDLYFNSFINFYKKDILKFHPNCNFDSIGNLQKYIVLRNANIVGIFCYRIDEISNVEIVVDYVTHEYRDFKNGEFVYPEITKALSNKGIRGYLMKEPSKKHHRYLKRMGFIRTNGTEFFKSV